MRRAVALAKRGYPAPNPHVGCVLVQHGVVIGEGWHRYRGADHAEVMALKRASDAKGSTAYVTLEPCNHSSSLTGPCSLALIDAGIREVFYACADPNPIAKGGAERLADAGVKVHRGLLESEARAVNIQFLKAMELGRPYVILKAAITREGVMGVPGRQVWITGPQAVRAGHKLRAECGAVLVGSGTVRTDDPLLTARIPGVVNQPVRIVLDPKHDLPKGLQVFGDMTAHTLRVTAPGYGGDVEAQMVDGSFDLNALLTRLFTKKVYGLLVEGGPETLQRFWEAGIGDRVDLFVSPTHIDSELKWQGARELLDGHHHKFTLVAKRRVGADTWHTFQRNLS